MYHQSGQPYHQPGQAYHVLGQPYYEPVRVMDNTGMPPTSCVSTTGKTRLRYSCVTCKSRKVRCNRQNPCSNCVSHKLDCVEISLIPPRRRSKKTEVDVKKRLKRCEEILKSYGVKLGPDNEVQEKNEADISTGPEPSKRKGMLIAEQETTRFVDNHLWIDLCDEFEDPREILQPLSRKGDLSSVTGRTVPENTVPDDSVLLFFPSSQYSNLRYFHPQPFQIFRLWQTFINNVNPLSKLLHIPTVQGQILEASAHLDDISKNTEALLFSIYTSAIVSLSNEDCKMIMEESRQVLLTRYSTAAQQALVRAEFLKSSDLVVLQALVLFLLAIRHTWEPQLLWILSGVVLRLAQRMGVHRDGGGLKISIFEAEMRRRLWWQIMILDGRSSQLAGVESSILTIKIWDAKLPSNLNDIDLYPAMSEMPLEHEGQTEMIYCLTIYEFCKFFQNIGATDWRNKSPSSSGNTDKWLNDLENRIESKFLRYCDPLIPLHFLSTIVARSIISNKKLSAHHPSQYPDKRANMSQEEKDILFTNALQMIEYDTQAHSIQSLKRFLWNIKSYFQLDVFIFLLSELRYRLSDPLADRAWKAVYDIYKYHPEFISNESNELYTAIGSLTLSIWQSREIELMRHHSKPSEIPDFILTLRSQRQLNAIDEKMDKLSVHQTSSGQQLHNIPAGDIADATTSLDDKETHFSNSMPLEMSSLDGTIGIMCEEHELHFRQYHTEVLRVFGEYNGKSMENQWRM